jgi:hypothetical protein
MLEPCPLRTVVVGHRAAILTSSSNAGKRPAQRAPDGVTPEGARDKGDNDALAAGVPERSHGCEQDYGGEHR